MPEVKTASLSSFASLSKRARNARRRFERTGAAEALDESIDAWDRLLADPEFASKKSNVRLRALNDAGGAYRRRHMLRGQPSDLQRSLDCLERALREAPAASRDRLVFAGNLASALHDQARRTGDLGDFDRALALWEDCLLRTPVGAKERPARLYGVAFGLSERHDRSGDLADLERAVALLDEAIAAAGESVPAEYHNMLGVALFKRLGRVGDPADLTRGLAAWEAAVGKTAERDPQYPSLLGNLGIGFAQRFARDGDPRDLDRGITYLERSVEAMPNGSPNRPAMFGNLCFALLQRHEKSGNPADVDRAVDAAEHALASAPTDSPSRMPALFNLGRARFARFAQGRNAADLDRAIEAFTEVIAKTGRQQSALPSMQIQLGHALHERYRLAGSIDDCNLAIANFENAAAVARSGSAEQRHSLNNLGLVLRRRYERLLQRDDLERAIAILEEAVRRSPPGSIDRAGSLHNLGGALHSRYLLTGSADDLDGAIARMEEATATAPAGIADTSLFLSQLGTALRDRYLRTGNLADLERGIGSIEAAVAASKPDSRDLPVMLGYLGLALMYAYEQTHSRATLARSVEVLQRGMATATDRAERAFIVGSLGCALSHAAAISGDVADFDRSILAFQLAVDSDPTSHNLPTYLGNLARGLLERYRRTSELADLERAIASIEQGLQLAGTAPIVPWFRLTLADLRRERFKRLNDEADRAAAVQTYSQAAHGTLSSVATIGLRAARSWGDWAFERQSWGEAAEAYECGLDSLSHLFRIQLSVDAQRAWLRAAEGLAARAAFAHARNGHALDAAVALERGRALLLAETLDRHRIDLERLREGGHGELADCYRSVESRWRDIARAASSLVGGMKPDDPFAEVLAEHWGDLPLVVGDAQRVSFESLQASRAELDSAIAAIRAVPGFEDFLALPGLADVRTAARPAPLVYIATTGSGGYAIIVRGDPATAAVVWLSEASAGELRVLAVGYLGACAQWRAAPDDKATIGGWLAALKNVTMWLSYVMEPVLDALAEVTQATLIPCGWLALLPLHAAWTEDASAPTGSRYASDRIALSYAPSARALAAAQEIAAGAQPDRLLAVEEPRPVTSADLQSAAVEVAYALRSFPDHQVFRHETASRTGVLQALPGFPVLHFACHANASLGNPLASGLLMANDEMLTVRDLLDQRMGGARLAVLSACETAVPGVELLDEQVGLPSGLLQAGIAGVVASLWAVADLSTMLLMRRFYEAWRVDGLDPAAALRCAQHWLRDSTNAEILAFLGEPAASPAASDADEMICQALAKLAPDARAFAHPFHWAAFIYVGA